jgi:hypothetical protein
LADRGVPAVSGQSVRRDRQVPRVQNVPNLREFPQGRLTLLPITAMIVMDRTNERMRAFSSILMAGLLTIQAVSGWCWHPARDCAGLEASTAPAEWTVKCCDGDCKGAHDGEPSQSPCKCRLECSGVCTFVPPEKTQVDANPQPANGFDQLAVSTALADSQAVPTNWTQVFCGTSELQSPLRLHLLHQILLI